MEGFDYLITPHQEPLMVFLMRWEGLEKYWRYIQEGVYSPAVIEDQLQRMKNGEVVEDGEYRVEYLPIKPLI